MRIRHIEVFHAVYTCGSMTRAAEELSVSQPSISKVLAHAELQLGFKLFERAHGRLMPTPEAERLYQPVAELFESLGRVRRVAVNLRESAGGRVRVASTPSLGIDILPEIVARFLERHEGTLFEVESMHLAQIEAALVESRIDLALAFGQPQSGQVSSEALSEGEVVLIAPASMDLPDRAFTLEEIATMPLIQLHGRSPLGYLILERFDAKELRPEVVAIAETYSMAKSLVAKGVGVALVDEFTAQSHVEQGVCVRRVQSAPSFVVSLLHLRDVALSHACQQFQQHVRSMLGSPAAPA